MCVCVCVDGWMEDSTSACMHVCVLRPREIRGWALGVWGCVHGLRPREKRDLVSVTALRAFNISIVTSTDNATVPGRLSLNTLRVCVRARACMRVCVCACVYECCQRQARRDSPSNDTESSPRAWAGTAHTPRSQSRLRTWCQAGTTCFRAVV